MPDGLRTHARVLAALLLFSGCGDVGWPTLLIGHRWDLTKPMRIYAASNLPRLDWYLEGLVMAIEEAGGFVANVPEAQVIPLLDTDGGDCLDQHTNQAFTSLNEAIYVCHSFSVLSPFVTKDEAAQVMRHELGHFLGNRRGHRACDEQVVMSPQVSCLPCSAYAGNGECAGRVLRYTPEDIDYICASGNTIGGICDG